MYWMGEIPGKNSSSLLAFEEVFWRLGEACTMEEVKDQNVGDVLALLESPQEDVVQEVRLLLKETLTTVREGWLMTGLLDYFFTSNSGRLLDILLGVSEPHDRHLLDRLAEGLKGPDRFRYTCLLLYAARRQPTTTWLRKFVNHGAMRELLNCLHNEDDVPVTVSGIMVLVMLLPALPLEMGHSHLTNILDIFCRLLRWSPKREQDEGFQPFLQVAVYSLFHRLYALYPCHFLTYLRNNFSKPNSSNCFFTTLKPMMEKVRLHPLLITETKDSELTRNRWIGLETHQLILECAKLCLDPIEATCEESCGSFFTMNGGSDIPLDPQPVPTNWMLSAVENNFWSPSLAQSSPAPLQTPRGSVPQTPVYPILTPNQRGKVAESPPEAAIEATPETTPFTSPIKMEPNTLVTRRPLSGRRALTLNTGGAPEPVGQPADSEANSSPMSPLKKDQAPFRFPENQGQDFFLRAERSTLLQTKLQQIQRERQINQIENLFSQYTENKSETDSKNEGDVVDGRDTKEGNSLVPRKAVGDRQSIENDVESKPSDFRVSQVDLRYRKRKASVYDGIHHVDLTQLQQATGHLANGNNDLDFSSEAAQYSETEDGEKNYRLPPIIDRRISEEKESEGSESRKSSDEPQNCDKNCDEPESIGLGVPSQRSMTDLVKNIKTMRLRFLSQCGPPPDLSQYNMVSSMRVALSPTKSVTTPVKTLQRSSSCPNLTTEGPPLLGNVTDGRVRKESAMSSLTLSPTRQPVMMCEASTQTEESNVINPYEQLLDVLVSGPGVPQSKTSRGNSGDTDQDSPSPHQLLDQYLQHSSKAINKAKNLLWQQNSGTDEGLKNQVRLMQTMLLLERYKREVHAERNRRLLGKAKKVYALEEEKRSLKEEVRHLESEVARLKHDLSNAQVNALNKEQQLQLALNQQQAKVNQVFVECEQAQKERELLLQQCNSLRKEKETLSTQLHGAQAALIERDRQLTVQAALAEDNRALSHQVETLHKQITLMGELQEQYKQQVWQLSLSGGLGASKGLTLERMAAHQQVEKLEVSQRIAAASLEAALARVAELENSLKDKEREVEEQQRTVKAAKEAGVEQCRVAERRCQALAATNQTLESYILEHNDRIDRLSRQVRRSQRGKSVCSDGFDIDLELSASPSSASCSSTATSPPDDMTGALLGRQPVVLNRLDALLELDMEPEGNQRRKT